jgi:glycosyltransferase involved in cell wall biosynthesis
VEVIHNGVDGDRFVPTRRRRQNVGTPGQPARLMHVSNFRAVKRPEDVVRVFARVAARIPAELTMVGDGPERTRAMALARDLKVADRVHFVGSVPRIEALIADADLFVLPSEQESFGLTALEAMASGVPVIASNVGVSCVPRRLRARNRTPPREDAARLTGDRSGRPARPAIARQLHFGTQPCDRRCTWIPSRSH